MKYEGIFPAVITPFNNKEEVDKSKMREFLDFVIEGGVHGIFLLGTNGEAPLLTKEEKMDLMEIAVEYVDGRVPIISGTDTNSTKEAIELGKHAENVGIDAIQAVVPYYFPASHHSLVNHYTKIAEKVDLPLFIYSFPARTGNEISIQTLSKLAEHPNIKGIKDSSGDVSWYYKAIEKIKKKRDDFIFFSGNDMLLYNYLSLGGGGGVSALANVFPELVVKVYEEFKSRNYQKAKKKQDIAMQARRAIDEGPYMAGVKGGLKVRGLDFGDLRSPLLALDKDERNHLEKKFKELDLI
ncbi:MAG: 4-hydroxy-tetrahydrodipicolinate synthase [Thermoplasmatota archaeon]